MDDSYWLVEINRSNDISPNQNLIMKTPKAMSEVTTAVFSKQNGDGH